MYLKSLEIQGFKSFPEKTRLTFEKPITAIVGPNGSGKSNISDAILWVMGEQSSRTLRGGKMEDVIFGGTQKRAQVGFAEVSLVLDNEDGALKLETNEVMITRRYYRSGESEYYINRAIVRLRDVNELFMDTGLGREGYSIIGQGKIDAILSVKSHDRREIFEEAAGISRYRHRKEESERKLQQTDENLVRINDKISELELQIEPLREQAETAKRYLLLRDELRLLEISVWLTELENLNRRAEKTALDYARAQQDLENAGKALETDYARSETILEMVRVCDVNAEKVRETASESESRLNEQINAAAVLRSRLESNITQIDRLAEELQTQDNRHDGIGAQISERESRLEEIYRLEAVIDGKTTECTRELLEIADSTGQSSGGLSDLTKAENEIQNAVGEARAEISALASQAQELYDRETAVRSEISDTVDKRNLLRLDYDKVKDELEKVAQETESLKNVINGYNLKVENRQKKAEAAGERHDNLAVENKTLRARKAMLSDMEKEFQGYSRAVKLIMQESNRGVLKNIYGTVGSLLKTTDKYTVAIETALGGAMQSIIVSSEEDGRAAINFLKLRDGGRATFLPVSTVRGKSITDMEVAGDSGYEGVALNLVEYDKSHNGVYANLLGRVIIATDLTAAIRISKKHGGRYKVVTLDGQVMNTGGSMTGGSAASNAGILTRSNEIVNLDVRIAEIEDKLNLSERELSEYLREKTAAEYELETAKSELRRVEDRFIMLESRCEHLKALSETSEDTVVALNNELADIERRIKRNNAETAETRERIVELGSEIIAVKQKIEKAMLGHERLSEEREKINAALYEMKSEKASLSAEREALLKTVSEMSTMRDEMSGSRKRQLAAIEGLRSENEDIRIEIQNKERAGTEISADIASCKNRLSELGRKKLNLEAERVKISKELQGKNQTILELERECSRHEQKKLASEMEEKQIIEKLWDTYELSRSAAIELFKPVENLSDAHKAITRLKRNIAELKNPNIGAIEEFERVNTRYTYLSDQRDDVEKAKSELLSIIYDITAQMREIFSREFKTINICFEETFKELFGGGNASLILEDPNDVLGCGIEIAVQPPGKSLKTLTLLSGGEKAFVAIALYFAILTVRPAPFVVMDEIEAALDDANVIRFARHMRKMSGNTQMVVISHRRGTMEEADVLYGVTMREMGVSSILRIDLEEAEKQIENI